MAKDGKPNTLTRRWIRVSDSVSDYDYVDVSDYVVADAVADENLVVALTALLNANGEGFQVGRVALGEDAGVECPAVVAAVFIADRVGRDAAAPADGIYLELDEQGAVLYLCPSLIGGSGGQHQGLPVGAGDVVRLIVMEMTAEDEVAVFL